MVPIQARLRVVSTATLYRRQSFLAGNARNVRQVSRPNTEGNPRLKIVLPLLMRTQDQIAAEIARLRELKPRVPRGTDFCEDSVKAIEAQIAVLENRLSIDEILDRELLDPSHADYFTEEQRDMAFDPRLWLDGADLERPSHCWQHYVL